MGGAVLPRQVPKEGEEKMIHPSALELAWSIIKAKKDAPNYRHASAAEKRAGEICGTCKAWDDSATKDPQTGYCEWYDFTCNRDHTCDAWAGGK
jgi:hypothetical protein